MEAASRAVSLLGAAVVAGLAFYSLRQLHDADTGHSIKGRLDRRLSLYSEQAFYYSYMEDFVRAPSLTTALRQVTHDSVAEHPGTINALQRFNILPELAVGLVYRTCQAMGVAVPSDPLDMFLTFVLLLAGLQWGAYFHTAAHLGQSPVSGALALLVVVAYNMSASRVTTAPALRENLSVPFLWLQVGLVQAHLRGGPDRRVLVALVAATVCFMVPWQFTQFLMLLQLSALFATYILGYIEAPRFLALLRAFLVAAAGVAVLTVGNGMLLTSMWLLLLVSIHAVLVASPGAMGSLAARCTQGLAASLLFAALKAGASFVVDDDGHVFKILKAKLFGYRDFMTELFLCGPTYRACGLRDLQAYGNFYLAHIALFTAVLIGVKIGCDLFPAPPPGPEAGGRKRGGKKKGKQGKVAAGTPTADGAATEVAVPATHSDPEIVFHLFQATLFCCLGFGIRRLSIVLVPSVGLLAAILASPAKVGAIVQAISRGEWRRGRAFTAAWLALAVVACALYSSAPPVVGFVEDVRFAGPQERRDVATGKLMLFLQRNTVPADIVAADPVLSSMVKLTVRRRIVIHPHAENVDMRLRHHQLFQIYNRVPEAEIHKMLRGLGADFLVLADGPCNLRCGEGQTMAEMANLAGPTGRPGNASSGVPQFCLRARQHPDDLALFREVFREGPFSVYRLLEPQ